MDNLLIYLLKVSFGLVIFYLSYILFFCRDTFYLRNRIFLIGVMLLSLLIPEINVFNISGNTFPSNNKGVIADIIQSGTIVSSSVSNKIISFDFKNLFILIYFSISGVFLLKVIISISRTLLIVRKGQVLDNSFPKVVISDSEHHAFSFFPYIVIPKKIYESGDYSDILTHEKAHIRQGHTFDILFTEFLLSFLWFNPFMWLIRRSVVLNHEYLADNFTIRGSADIKEYQYKILSNPICLMNVPLAHNFSSLIKNRIVMINKRPTQNYAMLKNIIILPVVAILFMIFSFRTESHPITGYQDQPFAKSSESEILVFLASNTGYPQEARNASDTGSIFVVVKINKGGIVQECKAYSDKKGISAPFLQQIVIVGHKSPAVQATQAGKNATGGEHPELKAECLRVVKKLSELKIPEWKDRNMEFAVNYKFIIQ